VSKPIGVVRVAPDARQLRYLTARSWFTGAAIAMVAIMLLTFLNAALAGGRLGSFDSERWRPLVAFPLIPIPWWVVVPIALVGVIAAVLMSVWARTPDRMGLMVDTLRAIVFVIVPLLCAGAYTDPSGIPMSRHEWVDDRSGWHWIGAAPQVVTFGFLIVRVVALTRRAVRNGEIR